MLFKSNLQLSIDSSTTNWRRITQLRGRRRLKKKYKLKQELKGKEKSLQQFRGRLVSHKPLEEGEIDEPYVPEYVDGVFTTEEARIDEEDEFAGEYAFHNDFLLNRFDEVITSDYQEAQNST